MSRSVRQSKILSIVKSQAIETQEELCRLLREDGFDVTQATVSRDIKELGLVKTQNIDGSYRYATKQSLDSKVNGKLLNVLREAVVSVVAAENLIVVKTIGDSAFPVSNALEQCAFSEVVGVLADRSTVLLVLTSASDAENVSQKIQELL